MWDSAMATKKTKRRSDIFGQYRSQIYLVILVLFLATGVFVFFKSFFDNQINNLTTEILAALMGSIITVIITMLLIRQQGTVEQAQETTAASKTIVFQEKLKLFREFITEYTKCAIDGHLGPEELERLEVLSMTISLLAKKIDTPDGKTVDLAKGLSRFVLQLELFGLADNYEKMDEEKKKIYAQYFSDLRQDDNLAFQDSELIYIVDILAMMKTELVMAQWDSLEMDTDLLDGTRYSQTWKLLNYRGYRQSS